MSRTRTLLLISAALLVLLTSAVGSAVARPRTEVTPRFSEVNTEFRPSENGFAFRNPGAGPNATAVEKATAGRCGGMAFGALDYYRRGEAPPRHGSFGRYLLVRSAESIKRNLLTFVAWTLWPDRSRSELLPGVGQLTRAQQVPLIARSLESGPVPLGLVRARKLREIGRNHQVVAYAIERRGHTAVVSVYDSLQPGNDDVVLYIDLEDPSAPVVQYAGDTHVATWRGAFVERYAPTSPPAS